MKRWRRETFKIIKKKSSIDLTPIMTWKPDHKTHRTKTDDTNVKEEHELWIIPGSKKEGKQQGGMESCGSSSMWAVEKGKRISIPTL